MGIDIYARWFGQRKAERQKQYMAIFDAWSGDVGYLREAYHGAPYATKYLVAEAFVEGGAEIPAETLRKRLPETLKLVRTRQHKLYQAEEEAIEKECRSFVDFVELCEQKEQGTGKPVTIIADF